MNDTNALPGLCEKIARLVEEKNWNLPTFARMAGLHRATAQQILAGTARRLHDRTVRSCADALGVTPLELRSESTERLLARMRAPHPTSIPDEIQGWLDRHPGLSADEIDELVALREERGSLTPFAISEHVKRLERRRRLVQKVAAVAGTEYVDLLEQFVDLLYEKVQPYADRN